MHNMNAADRGRYSSKLASLALSQQFKALFSIHPTQNVEPYSTFTFLNASVYSTITINVK